MQIILRNLQYGFNELEATKILRQKPACYNSCNVNFPEFGGGLLKTGYIIVKEKNLWRNYGQI